MITPRNFIEVSRFISKLFSVIMGSLVVYYQVLVAVAYGKYKFCFFCVQGELIGIEPFINTFQSLVSSFSQSIYIFMCEEKISVIGKYYWVKEFGSIF